MDAHFQAAKNVSQNAHCPYSHFAVGAVVQCKSGRCFAGCNVENASYGLTCCAERNAIFQMIASGEKEFVRIVIYTPTAEPTSPCGACRQVMFEFGPNADVISVCDGPNTLQTTVRELLPHGFGPSNLTSTGH